MKDADRDALLDSCRRYESELRAAGLRTRADLRLNVSPGWKFNHWELRGVPLRLELGPRDLRQDQYVLVRRDTGHKATFARAAELYAWGHDFEVMPRPPLDRMLRGEPLSPQEFIDIDDTDIWVLLKSWRRESDPSLSTLARGLLARAPDEQTTRSESDPMISARFDPERVRPIIDRVGDIAWARGVPRAHVAMAWVRESLEVKGQGYVSLETPTLRQRS